jgi:hypothetical protein
LADKVSANDSNTIQIDISKIQAMSSPTAKSLSIVVRGSPSTITFKGNICSLSQTPGVGLSDSPTSLKIDPHIYKSSWFEVRLAENPELCQSDSIVLNLAVAPSSQVPTKTSIRVWFDALVAELSASKLAGLQLVSILDGKVSSLTNCLGHQQSCSLKLTKDFMTALAKNDQRAKFFIWPFPVKLAKDAAMPLLWLNAEQIANFDNYSLDPQTVLFDRSLVDASRLDTSQDHIELPVRFSRSIEDVSCQHAQCRLTPSGILLFHLDPNVAQIKLRYFLNSNFYLVSDNRPVSTETITIKLDRCLIKIPNDVPLLGGTSSHRYFIKASQECVTQKINNLIIETQPPSQAYIKADWGVFEDGMRLLEIMFDQVPRGYRRLGLTLFDDTSIRRRLGSVSIPIAEEYTPVQIRFMVDEIGLLDFIPSNQPAKLQLGYSDPRWDSQLIAENRPGFFSVSRKDDSWRIQGKSGVTGNIPLHLSYRPSALNSFLSDSLKQSQTPTLATIETKNVFAVKAINVPLKLLPDKKKASKFIEVRCGVAKKEANIQIGNLARVAYDQRDSCRLVLHRDLIPIKAGTQRLKIKAGSFSQIVELTPKLDPLTITLPASDKNEYDTLTLSIAHDMLSGHYTLQSRQNLGEQAYYRILLSDSWFRISATTALPTGMFRFGSGDVEGTVPISAGALMRIVYLQPNGKEFPVGIESGPFGTNLSGQPDFSLVAGVGISIPVLNPNTSLQASFNIHAWLEYAPTRSARDEGAFAFLFGPSFTVGRISTTF